MPIDLDQYTAQIVPNTITTVSNHYFDLNQPFAVPRYGNECTPFLCGRDYMKAVADAIRHAQRFIFIADWQLDYDVELDNRGDPKHSGRLSELLADALARGVHVRILCYDSVDILTYWATKFGIAGPPDTHEETTQAVLNGLPKGKGTIRVMLQNPNTSRKNVLLDFAEKTITKKERDPNINFSHHQKFVVIDGNQAFLGGFDMAYGRWETPAFNVVVDPNIHVLNDAYNMQVTPARAPSKAELELTKPQANGRPSFVPPYYTSGGKLLDPKTQPRQPWNDVAVGIKGAAAYDVFVNFVLRWNSFAKQYFSANVLDTQLNVNWFEGQVKGQDTLVNPLEMGKGSANVQICRSASSAQLKDEIELWSNDRKYINDDWKTPNPKRRQIMQAARQAWTTNHQTSIYDAMLNCINAAQAYIYIENQFFMSDCGSDSHNKHCPSNNQIIKALANAIGKAIQKGKPFHVWIVLPEHPEGMLEEDGTKSQTWWALQGIKHGNESLINRINATIVDKYKKQWGVDKPLRTNEDIRDMLKIRGMQDKWREYLTVLNLRNYGNTGQAVVTEMIYTHSKLMIVDDAVAIIGSANINDRSLLGDGDTELSAVIADNAGAEMKDLGQGIKAPVRQFARNLRMALWKKLFGMLIDEPTTGVKKLASPPLGIDLEHPISKSSINGIFGQSLVNRQAYNRVFTHTPRDEFKTLLQGRNQYPAKTHKVKKYEINGTPIGNVNPDGTLREGYVLEDEAIKGTHDFSKLPPLQPDYMTGATHNIAKAMDDLNKSVKGYMVEMPLDWGIRDVTPNYPSGTSKTVAENNIESVHSNTGMG